MTAALTGTVDDGPRHPGEGAGARAAAGPDGALPVYTVICALYQEATSVDGLLSAIERLDYPRENLDVILAVDGFAIEQPSAFDFRLATKKVGATADVQFFRNGSGIRHNLKKEIRLL